MINGRNNHSWTRVLLERTPGSECRSSWQHRLCVQRWPIRSCFHVLVVGFASDIQRIRFVSCRLKAYATSQSLFPQGCLQPVCTQHSHPLERLNCSDFYLLRYVWKSANVFYTTVWFFSLFHNYALLLVACSTPIATLLNSHSFQITASQERNIYKVNPFFKWQ